MNESKGSTFRKDIVTSKNGKHLSPKKASGTQVKTTKGGNMPQSTFSLVKVCMSKSITDTMSSGFQQGWIVFHILSAFVVYFKLLISSLVFLPILIVIPFVYTFQQSKNCNGQSAVENVAESQGLPYDPYTCGIT